jgi:DNA polymerase-3 subunit delta'
MFEDFWGNQHVARALERMIALDRIPQTMLFSGPKGVGKATLARRFAAALLGHRELIEQDDLSLPGNVAAIAARERWAPDKRNDDPLLFATYSDFVTFPPEGPLRQISIQQMRLLKERAPYKPLRGRWRVFLVDHLDRANEQAANSLLKTLEEPPEHLILILTAENVFDLLPTIRSRAVPFYFSPLSPEELRNFAAARGLDSPEKRVALAGGSPGVAATLDLAAWEKRRRAMLALLQVASGQAAWSTWVPYSEALGRAKAEKLEFYLKVLYGLLRDLLILKVSQAEIQNRDLSGELAEISRRVDAGWIQHATRKTDELAGLLRRNIQKVIALDAWIAELELARGG